MSKIDIFRILVSVKIEWSKRSLNISDRKNLSSGWSRRLSNLNKSKS